MHYLLFYEKAPDYAVRQGELQHAHLEHVSAAARGGELVLAGSLLDPNDGAAVLVFKAESRSVAEAFARADPYVIHAVVNKWWVRGWDTVVGKDAVHPLSD